MRDNDSRFTQEFTVADQGLSPNSHLAGPAKTGSRYPSRFAISETRSHVIVGAHGHEPTVCLERKTFARDHVADISHVL